MGLAAARTGSCRVEGKPVVVARSCTPAGLSVPGGDEMASRAVASAGPLLTISTTVYLCAGRALLLQMAKEAALPTADGGTPRRFDG